MYNNPRETEIEALYPLGKWNLYIGGGGSHIPGYVNIDLFRLEGVDGSKIMVGLGPGTDGGVDSELVGSDYWDYD